jgi:hypothetical protein
MILDDGVRHQVADCGKVLHLLERLSADVDADQLAVRQREIAFAPQRRLHLVEGAGLSADIDISTERSANSPGRFGFLRVERLLNIQIGETDRRLHRRRRLELRASSRDDVSRKRLQLEPGNAREFVLK